MNTHAELQGATQHDFDRLAKVFIPKVVEAAARVQDITGIGSVFEAEFDKQVQQLCELDVEATASKEVLSKKIAEYLSTTELKDRVKSTIPASLEEDMQAGYEAHPLKGRYERTAPWAKWCQELGIQAPTDDADDDLQVASGAQFKNPRCVLTQKSIFELDDPVEDNQQFIWERSAITQAITQHGGRMENPAKKGTFITLQDLNTCRRVQREAQRRRRDQETQAANYQEIL